MISDTIKSHLNPFNDYIFGFSDLRGLIDKKFNGFDYSISIGKKLNDKIIDDIENGPTMEYYNYYNQINIELVQLAEKIQFDLVKDNIDSIIIEPTISTNSKEFEKHLATLTADISHKMVATRAGLGWIGKTDLFISKTFGPRLRLISILINQKPEFNSIPIDESKCGKCNICVDNCPAQSANGKLWNITVHRDDFFDAYKCRRKCVELAKQKLNVDMRICGLCISVCPIGKMNNK